MYEVQNEIGERYRYKISRHSSNGVVLVIFVGISSIFEDGGKERFGEGRFSCIL